MVTEHEKEMKGFLNEYMEVFRDAKKIYLKRTKEYDARESAVGNMLYGLKSFNQYLYGGAHRLISLETKIKNDNDIKKHYPKLIDTVRDLINYSIFLGIYLNRKIKQ